MTLTQSKRKKNKQKRVRIYQIANGWIVDFARDFDDEGNEYFFTELGPALLKIENTFDK